MEITPAARDHRHLVVFTVAPYGFCAPATEVDGIITVPHVRPLPQAPPSVIGVAHHRGQVYRVISLRRKLGLESGTPRSEGQLILTRLASGRAAFLVDEVVDVLPADSLVWRLLRPRSPMDLFDAFLMRDGQILFHTTFAQIEQAREAPYPNPDLDGLARAVDATTPRPSLREADAGGQTAGQAQDGAANGYRPRTIPDAKSHPTTRPKEGPGTSGRPRQRRSHKARSTHLPRNRRRSRRYALALTVLLVLLLVVVLSSALLLKARMALPERPPRPVETPSAPSPSITDPTAETPPVSSAGPVAATPRSTQKDSEPGTEPTAAAPLRPENPPATASASSPKNRPAGQQDGRWTVMLHSGREGYLPLPWVKGGVREDAARGEPATIRC